MRLEHLVRKEIASRILRHVVTRENLLHHVVLFGWGEKLHVILGVTHPHMVKNALDRYSLLRIFLQQGFQKIARLLRNAVS